MCEEDTTLPEDNIFEAIRRIKVDTDLELAKLEEQRQSILRRHEIKVNVVAARYQRAS